MPIAEGNIEVSKKTLLHISEGIYRTEGGSIKELISNAFDARANEVIINTNYPTFDILTCQDNGDGMTESEFKRIVEGGIGDSPKATMVSNERPVIGKLGIGILAIAQVCRSFTIISHHEKSKTAFKGRMIFRTDVDKVAKEKKIEKDKDTQNYQIGKWVLEEQIKYNPKKKGVLIFTKDLRQSYTKRFREAEIIQNHPKNDTSLDFQLLIKHFYDNKKRVIKELGPYYELIWELCQLSPLPYYLGTPIRKELNKTISKYTTDNVKDYKDGIEFIEAKQIELEKYNFSVIFDDIKLYRPVKLPFPILRNGKLQECQLFYHEYNNLVRGRNLKFKIYCIAQENAIIPMDLKGVQIRIKNVGIGLNDATFLKYGKNESPRDNWIFGEIYVEEGLDSALNIDRDSFNENDEHYYIVKEQLHDFFKKHVFPTIKSIQRKRNFKIKEDNTRNKLSKMKRELQSLIIKSTGYKITYEDSSTIKVNDKKKNISFPESILTAPLSKRRTFFASCIITLFPLFKNKLSNKDSLSKTLTSLVSILLS